MFKWFTILSQPHLSQTNQNLKDKRLFCSLKRLLLLDIIDFLFKVLFIIYYARRKMSIFLRWGEKIERKEKQRQQSDYKVLID